MESAAANEFEIPATYTIDLSLPPAKRYVDLATRYRDDLRSVTGIFDDLVLEVLPEHYLPRIKTLARLFLRRLHDPEETEEIRGIAETAGVEMYLIVALNVFLDLLMGCTSGAALHSSERSNDKQKNRLLHFRTLDWGMPLLRKLVVCLEFIRSDGNNDMTGSDTVLATSITYVGFVGVLTGVRKGLSISLNFRPYHDESWVWNNIRYYGSHVLVLLGLRRSISSMLRQLIIPSSSSSSSSSLTNLPEQAQPPKETAQLSRWLRIRRFRTRDKHRPPPHILPLSAAVDRLRHTPSTAAYLILCDGRRVYLIEKDHRTTNVEHSDEFLVATNNDRESTPPAATDSPGGEDSPNRVHSGASIGTGNPTTLSEFIEDSVERRKCMQAHWDKKTSQVRKSARVRAIAATTNIDSVSNRRRDPIGRTRSSQRAESTATPLSSSSNTDIAISGADSPPPANPEVTTATLDEIVTWTTMYPTTNEMTHFATVMDPMMGTVSWVRRYLEPALFPWN